MTERKVLNKYFPPDYDYRKIPRLKREKNAQWVQRVMAPFNMRCNTCGHYIYRGTKFNARRETALGETYLGLKIFRFYIRCPRCCADISFKTDIENLDYAIEVGATRNFESAKLIAQQEKALVEEKINEEANNPMKVLENRTRDSRREMEIMENLEELKDRADANARTDLDSLIGSSVEKQQLLLQQILVQQEEEDEAFINSLYEKTSDGTRIKRIVTDEPEDCDYLPDLVTDCSKPTSLLHAEEDGTDAKKSKCDPPVVKGKSKLSSLVRAKSKTSATSTSKCSESNGVPGSSASSDPSEVRQIGMLVQLTAPVTPVEADESPVVRVARPPSPLVEEGTSLGLLGDYSDSSSDGGGDPT